MKPLSITVFFSFTLTFFSLCQPVIMHPSCGGLNQPPCKTVYDNDNRDDYDFNDYMDGGWDSYNSSSPLPSGNSHEEPVDWSNPNDVFAYDPHCDYGYVIGPDGLCIEGRPKQISVSISEALFHGCNTESEVIDIVRRAQLLMAPGSRSSETAQKVLDMVPDGDWMTTLDITEKITVYRGTTLHWDIDAMERGYLKSKAMVQLESAESPSAFWSKVGPQITDQSPKYLKHAFQVMACNNSYSPPSQFVSIALTFDVALRFARSGYVYRFDVVPNSPILGMKGCSVNKGEVQYQIQGNTPITKLARSRNNITWEDYDFENKKWVNVKDELKRGAPVKEIVIGGLTWTAENVSVYVDNSICYQENDNNCDAEGRLYTYDGAAKACEKLGPGWRLPSDDDWLTLTRKHGGAYGDRGDGKKAYQALSGNGQVGFDGSHGGKRFYFPDVKKYYFYDFGTIGYYWSDTKDPNNATSIIGYTFRSTDNMLLREGQPSNTFISCRCVKD